MQQAQRTMYYILCSTEHKVQHMSLLAHTRLVNPNVEIMSNMSMISHLVVKSLLSTHLLPYFFPLFISFVFCKFYSQFFRQHIQERICDSQGSWQFKITVQTCIILSIKCQGWRNREGKGAPPHPHPHTPDFGRSVFSQEGLRLCPPCYYVLAPLTYSDLAPSLSVLYLMGLYYAT